MIRPRLDPQQGFPEPTSSTVDLEDSSSRALAKPRIGWGLPRDENQRLRLALWLVTLTVIAFFLWNSVWPCANVEVNQWDYRAAIPAMPPVGRDFREGIYRPALLLKAGKDSFATPDFYPPFTRILGLPFAFLEEPKAYKLQFFLLLAANLAALWLSAVVARSAFGRWLHPDTSESLAPTLVAQVGLLLFTSYGFLFSVERGNSDIYPLLLSVVALWSLTRWPSSIWLGVLSWAMAVHIKLYPLILFPLIFWRYRWKCLVPVLVTNLGLLLVLGWGPLRQFWLGLSGAVNAGSGVAMGTPYNHAPASFRTYSLVSQCIWIPHATKMLTLIPLALWAIGTAVLWCRGFSRITAVQLFVLSVPVMCLVPTISHDYKLPILAAPVAMAVYGCIARFAKEGRWRFVLLVVALTAVLGLLSRPYSTITTLWLQNKYPSVLLFELIVLVWVLTGDFRLRSGVVPRLEPCPASEGPTGAGPSPAAYSRPPEP
jgi:hypothetical protein